MTHHSHPLAGSACSIQINVPPNEGTVPHALFPVTGQYGGTGDSPVLIDVGLTYANPAGPGPSTGKLPPEDPVNQTFSRQFQNVAPTLPGQVGLLTAYLYDVTGTILLAQSTTIEITIV
jgi:hypothetical protein